MNSNLERKAFEKNKRHAARVWAKKATEAIHQGKVLTADEELDIICEEYEKVRAAQAPDCQMKQQVLGQATVTITRQEYESLKMRATQEPAITNEDVTHHAALHAYLGYTDSFKAGDVVTQGYIDRLHDHYLPNLMAAIAHRKPQAPAAALTEEDVISQVASDMGVPDWSLEQQKSLSHRLDKVVGSMLKLGILTAAMTKKSAGV